MTADPIHECIAVLRAVVQGADTNGIPTAENAVDRHIAFFPKHQQLAALVILSRDFAALWTNPSRDQQCIFETVAAYIDKRTNVIRDRDAA